MAMTTLSMESNTSSFPNYDTYFLVSVVTVGFKTGQGIMFNFFVVFHQDH